MANRPAAGILPANHVMPMNQDTRDALALRLAQIACEAGGVVMADDRRSTLKPDGSPVTMADKNAERVIRKRLHELDPNLVMIAEESFSGGPTRAPSRFVLVDPLDGTREFVAGRDEFAVNIALIEDGTPIAAAVYAPGCETLYVAGTRALRIEVAPGGTIDRAGAQPLATRARPIDGPDAVISRSHLDTATQERLHQLNVRNSRALGSSLKFCLIAEGAADVYPRLAPTMEWDTAAGHAVLLAAGGCVLGPDRKPLRYGKPGFRNTSFEAWGRAPPAGT